jgi:hypothetical protein
MSANSRLARLKRSPLVRDVPSLNAQRTQVSRNVRQSLQQQQQQQQMQQQGSDSSNMVQPMTILTWHEQRLNKMDEVLEQMVEKEENPVGADVIMPMIESIEALDKKVKHLEEQLQSLMSQLAEKEDDGKSSDAQKGKKGKKGKKDLKKAVEQSLESGVKLTVKEKPTK